MVKTKLQPQTRQGDGHLRELMLTCMGNLLSTSEERVYFKDLLSRFLFVSAGWVTAYTPGRTAGDLTGKTDFDVFTDQHACDAFADEQQIIRTGEPVVGKVEQETFIGRPDAWVSTTKMALRDEHGKIIGTFGITRDVTAQVTAEKALARQALELSTQNERLRELDGLKDEFIALVSHELRTPLASIIGYVELLRDERARGLDADHFSAVIARNSQRLLCLVEDLLFVSRIQSGKMELKLSSADLADIAAQAVDKMQPEAQRKHIDLTLSASAVPCFALDPTRITQLLSNLISNAVKFTPDGGRVEVRLGVQADQAVLTVADTGIGIPAADLERIFERFFRTATATREAIQGSGLGLTIIKAIVEAHNGTITVDSDEGHASTFKVCLPLLPVPASGAQVPGATSPPTPRTLSKATPGRWLRPQASGRRMSSPPRSGAVSPLRTPPAARSAGLGSA